VKTSSKDKIQKLTKKNSRFEKELDRLRIESECRLEEAQEDKDKLVKEIKRLQGHEEFEVSLLFK